MVDIVHTDAVDMTLAYISHVAESKGCSLELQVESQQVPETKRIARMRETDVMAAAPLRDIVIALAELRAEHTTHKGQVCLIVDQNRQFPNRKPVIAASRSRDVYAEPALSRIVGVAGEIEETQIGTHQASSLQGESVSQSPMIMPTGIVS